MTVASPHHLPCCTAQRLGGQLHSRLLRQQPPCCGHGQSLPGSRLCPRQRSHRRPPACLLPQDGVQHNQQRCRSGLGSLCLCRRQHSTHRLPTCPVPWPPQGSQLSGSSSSRQQLTTTALRVGTPRAERERDWRGTLLQLQFLTCAGQSNCPTMLHPDAVRLCDSNSRPWGIS